MCIIEEGFEEASKAFNKDAGRSVITESMKCLYVGRHEDVEIEVDEYGLVTSVRCRKDGVVERLCGVMERVDTVDFTLSQSKALPYGDVYQEVSIVTDYRPQFLGGIHDSYVVVAEFRDGCRHLFGADKGLNIREHSITGDGSTSTVVLSGYDGTFARAMWYGVELP